MKVDTTTAHNVLVISRGLEIALRLLMFGLGVFLAVIIYRECLHDPECNSIAVGYFSLLSLTFFLTSGLPVDKLVNADVVKKQ